MQVEQQCMDEKFDDRVRLEVGQHLQDLTVYHKHLYNSILG